MQPRRDNSAEYGVSDVLEFFVVRDAADPPVFLPFPSFACLAFFAFFPSFTFPRPRVSRRHPRNRVLKNARVAGEQALVREHDVVQARVQDAREGRQREHRERRDGHEEACCAPCLSAGREGELQRRA